jgi:apolipoprotein N-acyltransferase
MRVWYRSSPAAAARAGWLAGAFYYGILVSWSWYFGAVAIVPFVAVLAAYWALTGAGIAACTRRSRGQPVVSAAVWVLGEGLLARWPLGGFSWGEIGYAFHDVPALRAVAAVGGVPLLSFLAALVNATLANLSLDRRGDALRRRAWSQGTPAVVLVGAAVVIAALLGEPATGRPFRYALVQGNNLNRDLTAAEEAAGLLPEQHFALAASLRGDFDLIVFPESTFLDAPNAPDPAFAEFDWPERLAGLARRHTSYVLANGTGDAPDGRALNLDVLWDPRGVEVGEYAKRHLVPYGEWVPFRSALEGLVDELDQIPRDFAPGATRGLFDLGGIPAATVICFESMFGAEVRPLVADGAELIVVSTNNRSYRRSANSEQHVAGSQMRAAEMGRPVLHASISGISAVIDANGTVLDRQPLFRNGVVQGTITTRTGSTPYVRYGDWIAQFSLFAIAALAAETFVRLARARLRRWSAVRVP